MNKLKFSQFKSDALPPGMRIQRPGCRTHPDPLPDVQTKSWFSTFAQKTLLFLICLSSYGTAAFAISGGGFTNENLLCDLKWNVAGNYLEFTVMVQDDCDKQTNEWLDKAWVYINGKNLFDFGSGDSDNLRITEGSDETIGTRFRWNQSGGRVYILAQGKSTWPGTAWKTAPYSEYEINTSDYFACSEIPDYPSHDPYKIYHQYARMRWYPDTPITGGQNISVMLTHVTVKNKYGETTTRSDVSKSLTVPWFTAPSNQRLTDGTIQQGGSLKFTASASGDFSNLRLKKDGNVIATESGTNATFTDKYIRSESEFLNGVSFGLDFQKNYSGTKSTTYEWYSSSTLVSQRTGVFTNSLSSTLLTCGQIKLNWQIKNPGTTTVNKQAFDLQVKKGSGSWTTIQQDIAYNATSGGISAYEYIYQLPASELNKGTVNYEFRIKRKFADWDDTTFGNVANNQNLFQRNTIRTINTNYKELTSINLVPGADDYPRLTYLMTTSGIECTDGITAKLRIGGTETTIPLDSILKGSFQTTSDCGVEQCLPQRYELILQYEGLAAKIYTVSSNYVFMPTGKRLFDKLVVSKGYYPSTNNIKWYLRQGYDEFSRFDLMRRPLGADDGDWTLVTQLTHTPGLLVYSYDDNNVNAGIYYEYQIKGIYSCYESVGELLSPIELGFSQPYGSLSGRITYSGSQAVKNVKVGLSTSDILKGNRELEFSSVRNLSYVEMPANNKFFNPAGFSFQAWMKIQSINPGGYIIGNDNFSLSLEKDGDNEYFSAEMKGGDRKINSSGIQVSEGAYFHLTVTAKPLTPDTYEISYYIDGKLDVKETVTLSDPFPANASTVILGNKAKDGTVTEQIFNGIMDDIRFWNTTLTAEDIELNYDRMLSGKETNLAAYYKCDETDAISSALFDCSANGGTFNGNHAIKGSGINRLDVPLNTSHLSLRGITNEDGIYEINNVVPYTSNGTSYIVTPQFGIHSFDPNKRPLFFSHDSKVFNNVDFTDVSSFPVSLTVHYANSNYPVDSVLISIDGMQASKDGKLLITDSEGKVTVDVPIGSHFITISKSGHTFANGGRFPANELEKYNFQTSLSGLEFYDNTTVRLMGRVAGGQPETNKQLGFGLSKANIGKATLTLKTVNDVYRLNLTDNDSIVGNMIGGKNSRTDFKRSAAGSVIEVETNPETGEFLAVLPPVPYLLAGVKTAAFTDTGADDDPKDFSIDKSYFDINPLMAQTTEYTDPATGSKQTFAYHDSVKITHYSIPVIVVEDKDAVPGAFGDSIYVYTNSATGDQTNIPLYSATGGSINYALDVPVLTQKKLVYTWNVKAYEEYENIDATDPVVDRIPLAGNEISISNSLAAEQVNIDEKFQEVPGSREDSNTRMTLDSAGMREYKFKVSFPNMAGNHQLTAKLSLNSNGKEYLWEKSAILFGQITSDGNNFVTSGPDYVDIVLHDPPGSNSSAYIEQGSSFTKTVEDVDVKTGTESVKLTSYFGFESALASGFGVLYITDIKNRNDVVLGTAWEEQKTDNNTTESTITFNQKISTSDDPSYVGSMADVYIGRSTNLIYGQMNQLALYPTAEKPAETPSSGNVGDYSLFSKEVNTVGFEFGTMFSFTQQHLIDHQIPEWKSLRNQLLTYWSGVDYPKVENLSWRADEKVKYLTHLTPENKNYGMDSTYRKYVNPNINITNPADTIDRIISYNANIRNWEERIRDNEEYKVKLFEARLDYETSGGKTASDVWNGKKIFENLSFDAGVSLEKSIDISYEKIKLDQFLWTGGGTIGGHAGFKTLGIGFQVEAEAGFKRQQGTGTTDKTGNSMKFGYSLKEDESVHLSGKDALSLDVYAPFTNDFKKILSLKNDTIRNLHGFVFRTRAGQTSCPYEPADSTLFYVGDDSKPKLLNYGTFQIEKPQLMIDGQRDTASAANISAGREATFELQLSNLSEAKMDVTYQLYPDNATNPDGLILSIDGEPLTQARQIKIPYGQTLTKTLKARQSSQDILDYAGIGIKLGSICDNDNFSETFIKVNFIPSSSPITLASTSRLANRELLDKEGKITFTLSGYDRSFRNFGLIRLQYRNVSSENWTSLKEYVNDEKLYTVSGNRELIGVRGSISYNFDFSEITPSDGQYIFRALAVSKIGQEEITSASDEILVVKDVRAPQVLGTPQPAGGILSAGSEISLTFNKDIQSGKITSDKFTVTGILNTDLRSEPTTGLNFNGTASSYAQTELPIYANGSFTIETWLKRSQATAGTVFAYGEGENYISLGFDATNHAVVKIGGETYSSSGTVSVDEVWKYAGLSYDRTAKTVSVYVLEGENNLNLIDSRSFTAEPVTQGKLLIGNNGKRDSGFTGTVALTEFYNVARIIANASASKNIVKSGKEPNLIGLWEMEEAEGNVAKDKARARNLQLNTSWYIYPSGHSLAFNGTSDYATLPSGTFPFISVDDFTWELWFTAPSQGVATLLSIGSMATIDFNDAHELVLNSDGKTQVLSSKNLLDGQWHHLALSVKRSGQAKAHIDGKVSATFTSSTVFPGSVGGGYYYLGAKYTQPDTYSQYFSGNIDEVRVWNSSLATENIVFNKNGKLRGNEAGLLAYYPFESYQKRDQIIDVYGSLNDAVDGSASSAGNMTVTSTIAVPVKDARPVKNVPFTFTASDRKIVLNLTEEAYRLEDVTLTITAKDILDMHNNVSTPVSWLAYVNQNTLLWDSDPVNIVMQQGEKKTFTARITNSGATTVSYTIGNIPGWLNVNSSAGSLLPLASKELTFTVSGNINIGNYETAIELTGSNGISELLPIQIKVTGVRPDWKVNPEDFELSMTATGQLFIEGALQEDEEDLLAAFIGDVCVGLASPQYETTYNAAFIYMTIWGNTADNNKSVSFKLWDASTGNIYPIVETSIGGELSRIQFSDSGIEGTPDAPICFNAREILEQSVAMSKGWNWISFNVNDYTVSLIDQFKTNAAGFASQIKTGNSQYLNNSGGNWGGGLSSITPKEAYLVRSNNAASLKMLGKTVKPAETIITLTANKWSWIGYTPQFAATVAEALAGISNPQQNDQIKGQKGYRMMSANGWIGSLSAMEPGRGYMYKSNNMQSVQFNYPSFPSSLRNAPLRSSQDIKPVYEPDIYRYSNTMTVTASLWFGNMEIGEGQYEIVAFSGDECRGSALLESVDGFEHGFMAFLMIYGEGNETIRFLIVDHETGKEYEANEYISFETDAIYGAPDNLYRISSSVTGIGALDTDYLNFYPNPVEKLLYIRYKAEKLDKISISDISGRLVWYSENFAGESIDVGSFKAGVYLLKVQNEEQTSVYKFIKK